MVQEREFYHEICMDTEQNGRARILQKTRLNRQKKLAAKSDMDIDFFVCKAENVDFPDETFDVITACQCIWYPDQRNSI